MTSKSKQKCSPKVFKSRPFGEKLPNLLTLPFDHAPCFEKGASGKQSERERERERERESSAAKIDYCPTIIVYNLAKASIFILTNCY